MKLRQFLKSLLVSPVALVPEAKVAPAAQTRPEFFEMMTEYGTPVLVCLFPCGEKHLFCHCPKRFQHLDKTDQQHWDKYNGDTRDLILYPWRTEGDFPVYHWIRNWILANYDKTASTSSP